jgi:hypothetical protein
MKSKIILFLIILFFTSVGTQAQPGCGGKFSPYNICNTDYAKADFIFFGEVITLGKIDHDFSINGKKAFAKTVVEVKKTFKGKPNNRIELFLDYDIICEGNPPVGSTQIYNVNKTIINGQTIYYSNYVSRPLTDYSPQALKEVFSSIQSVLNNKKANSLDGIIFERLATLSEVRLKNEEADRYFLPLGSFKPAADIIIEAISEQDKKVYRTKSKADGTYEIENIPPGKYKLLVYLNGGKVGERLDIKIDSLPCKRTQDIILE